MVSVRISDVIVMESNKGSGTIDKARQTTTTRSSAVLYEVSKEAYTCDHCTGRSKELTKIRVTWERNWKQDLRHIVDSHVRLWKAKRTKQK
jgi:hypothetical protein